jgi:hypothetical protein
VIDVTEHALKGLTLSQKLHRLAAALRDCDECAWPDGEHVAVVGRDGARMVLLPDDAVRLVERLRRERPAPSHRPVEEMTPEMIQEGFRRGLLHPDVLMQDSVGRLFLPVAEDGFEPQPRRRQRI